MSGEIKRAIISVSDKTGLVAFAKDLQALGVELISTGNTHHLLMENGVQAKNISEVTGFPEILDGRVKTLHPAVHSGILAVREKAEHRQQLRELDLETIDLVVVNLYPFKETIAKSGVSFEEAIENIDIGGPSMLRAAAKNHQDVTVIVDREDYTQVVDQLRQYGKITETTRRYLAAKVFRHTAAYDALIAQYLSEQMDEELPQQLTLTYEKGQDLRYGENPHQTAAFYRSPLPTQGNIATARQLHGKELSYNNIQDADAALNIVKEFSVPAVAGVKHTNPCGVGVGESLLEAWHKAYESDPVSIFGGIVAANRPLDGETAMRLKELFLEMILAPSFDAEALEILTQKKNLRLMETGDLRPELVTHWTVRSVGGGLLVQESDDREVTSNDLRVVTNRAPTEEEVKQLLFAWKVVKHVKSNAIVLAAQGQTVGIGAGQMNRVGSARIAIEQAGAKAKGSVMASDAFFPMPDTAEEAAKAGVTAIIQPGGSIRDEDSIATANRYGMAMVFTGVRHFQH